MLQFTLHRELCRCNSPFHGLESFFWEWALYEHPVEGTVLELFPTAELHCLEMGSVSPAYHKITE